MNFEQDDGRVREVVEARKRARAVAARSWAPVQAVILAGAIATFGLRLEAVAIILGVDAIMDMARTSVNLVGNCLASAAMARWEGELQVPVAEAERAAA